MDLAEALGILGLEPGTPMQDVREAYRHQVRTAHPDLVGPGGDQGEATARTARITSAFAVVRRAVIDSGTDVVPDAPRTAEPGPTPDPAPRPWEVDRLEVDTDGDTIAVAAPPAETFALLLDAGSRLGGIGYVDRQLGILEIIVRFEGGPSCSVLITLQGRAFGTDAFCTMDSIEAAPTPPLRPVVEALVEELTRPR